MKKNLIVILVIVFILIYSFRGIIPNSKNVVKSQGTNNINLKFTPFDTIIDSNKPIIYMTSKNEKKVYSVNYETGEIKSIQFSLTPEKLAFSNNELYVTLLKINHEIYPSNPLTGAIGIINANSFTIAEQFDIDTDPYDIEIDNQGYIYISPGSGQWEDMKVYSRSTKNKVSQCSGTYRSTEICLRPATQKLYAISPLTPRDIEVYQFSVGKIQRLYDSTYHGNYDIESNIRISPDGKYVFNSAGTIFNCSDIKEQDLVYENKLRTPFTDIAFDLKSNKFFAGMKKYGITVYNYNTFEPIGALSTEGEIKSLYFQNKELIAVTRMGDGNFNIEIINTLVGIDKKLQVQNSFPQVNSTNVITKGVITLKFNSYVNLNNKLVTLTDKNGNNYAQAVITYNDFMIIYYDDLSYNTKYVLNVDKDSVINYVGKSVDQNYSLSFTTGSEFTRLAGNDRYKTCVKISQAGWTESEYVVLATGENFPDALCASPLASKYNAPILLTTSTVLNLDVEAEIDRLKSKVVFIVGGSGVISDVIKNKIEAKGIQVIRIAGKNRYETSIEIANKLAPSTEVFIVTGEDYPDALSIASYAASNNIPILLTARDALSVGVSEYVYKNNVTNTYIIGGAGVVDDNIYYAVPWPKRIAGSNRYDTNLEVFSNFQFDFSTTYIATADNFTDALAGSALAARINSPIVLVGSSMPQEVIDSLSYNKSIMKSKCIIGGTGVISDNIVNRIFK